MTYTDAGALAFAQELERIYKEDLERGTRDTHIDELGAARWYGDFRILTELGLSDDQATQSVRNEIYRLSGIPIPVTRGLTGVLRRVSDGWKDDTGYILPRICHFGDGLSLNIRNPGLCDTLLDAIADAGYHGVRTWTVLRGSYWSGRETGPNYQSDYREEVIAFAHKLHLRGLRWMVSQGDLMAEYSSQSDRKRVLKDILTDINSVSPLLPIFVDIGNETWKNGEPDAERLTELAIYIQQFVPNATITLTSPQGETKDELDNYTFHVYDVHGSRAGRYWDKVRHIFSIPFEGKPRTRNGVQSENTGPGRRVSDTQHQNEIDANVCALLAAQSNLARQVWVYFSGPGVMTEIDKEKLWEMPGFYEVPDTIAKLPQDLMTFQKLCHGGTSQADRIYAVPSVDETRADHAIHSDGRFVCVMYGPQWRKCRSVRPHTVTEEIPLGDKGRIVIGCLQ